MSQGPVQLFVTCLVDGFFPQVGVSVVRILERLGFEVGFPLEQTCCGQPAFNAGYLPEARRMAEHTVGVLDGTEGPIVVPSGSCADMMIHHAPELLEDSAHEAAVRVAGRTRELTQFLVDDLGVTDLGAKSEGSVVYHPSCHGLRNLGLTYQPQALLDSIDGVSRRDLAGADECCGFGGLFSFEMPDVSAAMLDTKLANVTASGADLLVGGDVSCLMHMAGGLRRRGVEMSVKHIAEMLGTDEGV